MNSFKRAIQGAISATLMAAVWLIASLSANGQQPQQSPEAPKIIRKSGGALQAAATTRVEPEYPLLAKAAHVTGAVVVEVTTDEAGNVISAKALSGHPLLKDSAVVAARQWKFAPTTLSGVAVKVTGAITFNFALGDDSVGDSVKGVEKEVRDHPDSAQAYYKLALAYNRENRLPEAIQALKDAVRIDPEFGLAYFTLGDYLLGSEQNAGAVDALKNAIRRNPHQAKAHVYLGIAFTKLGRYEEALGSYKEAIKEDASEPGAYASLAITYVMMGKYEEAVEPYKQAIKRQTDTDNPSLYYSYLGLAAAYAQLGGTADQIEALKQAIALHPRFPDGHFGLGMTYLSMGDKKSATEQYNVLKGLDAELARKLKDEIDKRQ